MKNINKLGFLLFLGLQSALAVRIAGQQEPQNVSFTISDNATVEISSPLDRGQGLLTIEENARLKSNCPLAFGQGVIRGTIQASTPQSMVTARETLQLEDTSSLQFDFNDQGQHGLISANSVRLGGYIDVTGLTPETLIQHQSFQILKWNTDLVLPSDFIGIRNLTPNSNLRLRHVVDQENKCVYITQDNR